MVKTKEAEDKIRDLINWVQVKNTEELEEGEGKQIENAAAEELKKKLQEIAQLVGKINSK